MNRSILLYLILLATISLASPDTAYSGSVINEKVSASYIDGNNLDRYLECVRKNNEEIRSLEFSVKKELETIRKELAYQRVSAGISGTVEQWIDSESRDGYTSTSAANVYLRQQLEFSGKYSAHIKYLVASYRAAEFAFQDRVNTILAQAAGAYVEASISRENIVIQEQVLANRQDSLTATKHKFKEGMVPELDVIRASQQVDDAKALLENANRNYANALAAMLKFSTERFEAQPLNIEGLRVTDFSLEKGLSERPDLSRLQMNLLAAKMNRRMAAKGLTPTFQLTFSWGFSNQYLGKYEMNLDDYEGKVSLGAEIPILDGGKTKHQKMESAYLILETESQIESLKKNIGEEVSRAESTLAAAQRVEKIKLRSKQGAQKALWIAEEMYKDGILGQIDLINAQESDQNAQTAYIQALKELADAHIEERRVIGGFCDIQP